MLTYDPLNNINKLDNKHVGIPIIPLVLTLHFPS
jgi:hypothetical protein